MIVFTKPKGFPLTRVVCPECGQIVTITVANEAMCKGCSSIMYPEMAYMPYRIFFRLQYYNEEVA